ncbi:isoprenoid synthase domain-containing protein [Infundibulicybe gibba]|nr:isoprenoid synthase domain-containing protein [Infundibulicybe gibba]
MSISLYSHLSISRQYYVCIYTALLVHLDDLAMADATVVEEFNTTFLLQNGKHTHPILDGLEILLRTTQDHFSKNNTSMIITNTLDFISSLIMEEDQQSMTVHSAATNYPGYLRSLTGIGRAFALFFFPPDIPPQTYVQIVPDMINYLANVNDIFSFYKEELAGEMGNHVSLIARVRGCTKLEALEHLVQISIDDARRMVAVLESYPELCTLVQKNMVEGCVRFHTFPRERYRLDDLHLDDDKC